MYAEDFPIEFHWHFHKQQHPTATLACKFPSCLCSLYTATQDNIVVLWLCPVRLCETAGWEGAAQVLDWSHLNCQSPQRSAAERPPGNGFHWVHGPWDLAPCCLQWWTQPWASGTPQHSHRWGHKWNLFVHCLYPMPLCFLIIHLLIWGKNK